MPAGHARAGSLVSGVALAVLSVALGLAGSSCARPLLRFQVETAPAFAAVPKSVSLFGVYRAGTMSTTYWEVLAPQLEAALGWRSCEVGFGRRLAFSDPVFFSRLQTEAKREGITRELLGLVAPRAKGKLLLVISVFGRPPPLPGHAVAGGRPGSRGGFRMGGPGMFGPGGGRRMGGGMMGGGMMGRGMMGGGRRRGWGRRFAGSPRVRRRERRGVFEMFAELYAVSTLEVLARVEMQYRGPSLHEAIMRFAQKLQTVLPASTCVGWRPPPRRR